jgi:hypothetical protein
MVNIKAENMISQNIPFSIKQWSVLSYDHVNGGWIFCFLQFTVLILRAYLLL